jgi:hypothetical protein
MRRGTRFAGARTVLQAWILAGSACAVVAGCASATMSPTVGSGVASTGSVSSGGVVSASAASVGAMPAPSSSTPSPEPCRGGVIEVTYQPGDARVGELCVHVGAELSITLTGPSGYAWTAVTSSDPKSAVVSSSAGGVTGRATVRAMAAGSAVLRATTSFTADPYGPPTQLWQLTLIIEP